MANRIIQTLFKWKKKDGSIDTYYFKNRAKDVIIPNDEEGNARTLESIITKVDTVSEGATKTSAITGEGTNGYILVDNVPVKVYEQPTTPDLAGTYNKVIVDDAGNVVSGELLEDWDGTVSGKITEATSEFTEYSARENIQSGEKTKFIFGKIMKWFSDLGAIAFKDKVEYTDLSTDAQGKIVKTENISQSTTDTSTTKVPSVAVTTALKKSIDAINSNLSAGTVKEFTEQINDMYTTSNGHQFQLSSTAQNTADNKPLNPISNNGTVYYNTMTFGIGGLPHNRLNQLAFSGYVGFGFDDVVWIRSQNDDRKTVWKKLFDPRFTNYGFVSGNPLYVQGDISGYTMIHNGIIVMYAYLRIKATIPADTRIFNINHKARCHYDVMAMCSDVAGSGKMFMIRVRSNGEVSSMDYTPLPAGEYYCYSCWSEVSWKE